MRRTTSWSRLGSHPRGTDDIVGTRWQKCAWNAVFNPLSAIGNGLGTREILAGEEGLAFVRAAIAEVAAIAAADDHRLPPDTAERQIYAMLLMAASRRPGRADAA